MRATSELPVSLNLVPGPYPRFQSDIGLARASLPRVERIEHHGPVLHAGPLVERSDVLSLNMTKGCAHRCPFCSVRGQAAYSGDDVVYLFTDTAERLKAELASRRRR